MGKQQQQQRRRWSASKRHAASCHVEEEEWLPNPYQDIADAQVWSGALPGMWVLIQTPTTSLQQPSYWLLGSGNTPTAMKLLSHHCVPKSTDLSKGFGSVRGGKAVTTLMIRNIPNAYTRSMFVSESETLGFTGQYNFLYLPIDKGTEWNVGYAFVNFLDPEVATRCAEVMTGYVFSCYNHGSGKLTQVSVAHIQGLKKNLAYYNKTAVRRFGTSGPLV